MSQAWALVLGSFNKQTEPKQKNLFINKLMSYKAWYKIIQA